jgi:hypothetical protein
MKTKGTKRGFGPSTPEPTWEQTKALMGDFEPLKAQIPSQTARQIEALAVASETTVDELVTTLLIKGLARFARKLEGMGHV